MSPENIELMKESYARLKNLKLVAKEINIPWQTVYWWLKKVGVEVVGDKSRYGGSSDSVGLVGETLFKKLFPEAIYENDSKFQAKCDFTLHGLRVDIKTSSLRENKVRGGGTIDRWGFNCYSDEINKIDFFVCFCLSRDSTSVDKILLLPSEMVTTKTGGLSVSPRASKWDDFAVTEKELVEFFNNFKQS